jgi:hypothetical protein
MQKKVVLSVMLLVSLVMVTLLAGCGSGGGLNTSTGTLTLTVSDTSGYAGYALNATATIASTATTNLNGIEVKLISSGAVIATGTSDGSGFVRFSSVVPKIANKAYTMQLQAVSNNTSDSNVVSVPVKVPTLTLTADSMDKTFESYGTATYIPPVTVTLVDAYGNPITPDNGAVTMSAKFSADSCIPGTDIVMFTPNPSTTLIAASCNSGQTGATYPVTSFNNAGTAAVPVTVNIVIGKPHVIDVTYTADTVYKGVTFNQSAKTAYTATGP